MVSRQKIRSNSVKCWNKGLKFACGKTWETTARIHSGCKVSISSEGMIITRHTYPIRPCMPLVKKKMKTKL